MTAITGLWQEAAMSDPQLSPRRRALMAAISTAPGRGWHEVTGLAWRSVRWDRIVHTPAWALTDWNDMFSRPCTPLWTEPVFTQHVFVRVPGGVPLIRFCPAPWVSARDVEVTLSRALAILTDPAAALDTAGAYQPVTPAEVML